VQQEGVAGYRALLGPALATLNVPNTSDPIWFKLVRTQITDHCHDQAVGSGLVGQGALMSR
jgi:hypothetical protein